MCSIKFDEIGIELGQKLHDIRKMDGMDLYPYKNTPSAKRSYEL